MKWKNLKLFALTAGFLFVPVITTAQATTNSPTKPPDSEKQAATAQAAAASSTYTMKIDFDRRIKMRDGVELSADVYHPDAPGKFPVILRRTPYVKASGGARVVDRIRKFVSQGYVFVYEDVRGRGDSD